MGQTSAVRLRSDEMCREIELTRTRIEHRAEALRTRMSPSEMLRPLTDRLGDTLGEGLGRILNMFRESPVPLGMVGIGIWWLISNDRRSSGAARKGPAAPGGSDAGAPAAPAPEAAPAEGQPGAQAIPAKAFSVGSAAREMSEATRRDLRRTGDWFSALIDENPLLCALGTLAVGLAAGLTLPSTGKEEALPESARAGRSPAAPEGAVAAGSGAAGSAGNPPEAVQADMPWPSFEEDPLE